MACHVARVHPRQAMHRSAGREPSRCPLAAATSKSPVHQTSPQPLTSTRCGETDSSDLLAVSSRTDRLRSTRGALLPPGTLSGSNSNSRLTSNV